MVRVVLGCIMFELSRKAKKINFQTFGCSGAYEFSFFRSYNSFQDTKSNVKALIYKPIINLFLSAHAVLNGLILTTLGIINLAIGLGTFSSKDLELGGNNVSKGFDNFIQSAYYAASIITDFVESVLRLITHTLGTIGYGINRAAQCVSSVFEPSCSPKY